MHETAVGELRQQILATRSAGTTHVLLEETTQSSADNLTSVIDSALTNFGFKPVSMQWRVIELPEAQRILVSILHRDLAYGVEVMPFLAAEDLADRFCALFPSTARYFTNSTWQAGRPGEPVQISNWSPLTDATFDVGIVAVGEGSIGVVWVEDED